MREDPILTFRNVSCFPEEEFGLSRISFKIERHKNYYFKLKSDDQLKCLLSLIEKRFKAESGYIDRCNCLFFQSDRQLMGDKIYDREVGSWFDLNDSFFYFDGRRRSKEAFIDKLKFKSHKYSLIYKLRGKDKLKFAILSMVFQGRGIIFISQLLKEELPEEVFELLCRLIKGSDCAVCLLTSEESKTELIDSLLELNEFKTYDFLAEEKTVQIRH